MFFACSVESKDQSLIEVLQGVLALGFYKVRSSGEFADCVIITMIDAIMGAAIEFIQVSRGASNNAVHSELKLTRKVEFIKSN